MVIRQTIQTARRCELVDITKLVGDAVAAGKTAEGTCTVYCPHTTGGITINEGADPDVAADILTHLERLVPAGGGYRHAEGNADAHIKATLVGASVSVPIRGGRLGLGTWQKLFFCEFDGPRRRSFVISITPAASNP